MQVYESRCTQNTLLRIKNVTTLIFESFSTFKWNMKVIYIGLVHKLTVKGN